MAVGGSSVLAGIQNPAIADVAGSFREGEQQGREDETRRLAGDILSQTIGGKLGALGKVSPKDAIDLSKALGVPTNDKQRLESMIGDIQVAATIFESAGPKAAAQFIGEKSAMLEKLGIPPQQYIETLQGLSSDDPEVVQDTGETLVAMRDGFVEQGVLKRPGGSERFSPTTKQLPDGTVMQTTSTGRIVVTGPDGQRLIGKAAADKIKEAEEFGAELQGERARLRTQETESEKDAFELIDRGTLAAESTAVTRRAITLLDRVATGGVDAISLAVKQKLGIEGADEGELSNSLGKAVLSQLKETFGAQFTEEEGKRLTEIEAGFTKSSKANKRLLKQALRISERTARRARRLALRRGKDDVVADIDELLEFSLDLDDNSPQEGAASEPLGQDEVIMKDAAGVRAVVNQSTGEVVREL